MVNGNSERTCLIVQTLLFATPILWIR